ncbi:hypothetical protein IHE44_0003156 [Lamprotornis superbus]|uniref:G-protein coupled receptors family 1 profile domain-containing protein n=1 Tax=Lamprotornis superbus TaxID=245042 RepID=A0A835NPJ1_9PASS|nr:hypothetical protein IHE44_0003156 [Lamprotornis superbus]
MKALLPKDLMFLKNLESQGTEVQQPSVPPALNPYVSFDMDAMLLGLGQEDEQRLTEKGDKGSPVCYYHGQQSEQGGEAGVMVLLSLTRHKFAAPADDPPAFFAEIHLGPEQFNKPNLLEGARIQYALGPEGAGCSQRNPLKRTASSGARTELTCGVSVSDSWDKLAAPLSQERRRLWEGTDHAILDSTLTHTPPSLNPISPSYCTNETPTITQMVKACTLKASIDCEANLVKAASQGTIEALVAAQVTSQAPEPALHRAVWSEVFSVGGLPESQKVSIVNDILILVDISESKGGKSVAGRARSQNKQRQQFSHAAWQLTGEVLARNKNDSLDSFLRSLDVDEAAVLHNIVPLNRSFRQKRRIAFSGRSAQVNTWRLFSSFRKPFSEIQMERQLSQLLSCTDEKAHGATNAKAMPKYPAPCTDIGLLVGRRGNIFVVSLSVADLVVAVYPYPLILSAIFHNGWTMGNVHCQISGFLMGLSVIGSIFNITAIALNRYCYICHSLRYDKLFNLKNTCCYLCLTWILTVVAIVPNFFVGSLQYDPRIYSCTFAQTVSTSYTIMVVVVHFIVPLSVVTFCYLRIWILVIQVKHRTLSTIALSFPGHNFIVNSSLYDFKYADPALKQSHKINRKQIELTSVLEFTTQQPSLDLEGADSLLSEAPCDSDPSPGNHCTISIPDFTPLIAKGLVASAVITDPTPLNSTSGDPEVIWHSHTATSRGDRLSTETGDSGRDPGGFWPRARKLPERQRKAGKKPGPSDRDGDRMARAGVWVQSQNGGDRVAQAEVREQYQNGGDLVVMGRRKETQPPSWDVLLPQAQPWGGTPLSQAPPWWVSPPASTTPWWAAPSVSVQPPVGGAPAPAQPPEGVSPPRQEDLTPPRVAMETPTEPQEQARRVDVTPGATQEKPGSASEPKEISTKALRTTPEPSISPDPVAATESTASSHQKPSTEQLQDVPAQKSNQNTQEKNTNCTLAASLQTAASAPLRFRSEIVSSRDPLIFWSEFQVI